MSVEPSDRKELIRILKRVFGTATELVYNYKFPDKVNFKIRRKNKHIKYYVTLDISPYCNWEKKTEVPNEN